MSKPLLVTSTPKVPAVLPRHREPERQPYETAFAESRTTMVQRIDMGSIVVHCVWFTAMRLGVAGHPDWMMRRLQVSTDLLTGASLTMMGLGMLTMYAVIVVTVTVLVVEAKAPACN